MTEPADSSRQGLQEVSANEKSLLESDPAKSNDLRTVSADEESLLESGPVFTPRVSQQRYTFVKEVIRDLKSKKVIDMGCGECQLIVKLKREMCIERLAGVDINRNFLEASKHLIQPLLCEYMHGRETPLMATLYQGSIAECDSRLVNWDLLVCVEVIEHLEVHDLQRVPDVVFGFLRPVVAVVTTPNADFNVLFPGMESRFRHWDHKFEWTRQEFQEWGDNICKKYRYKVRYTGVGKGPDGTEPLGMCTQIGVFERLERQEEEEQQGDVRQQKDLLPYSVVQHNVYPYKPDTMTTKEKILLQAEYYTHKLSYDIRRQHSSDEEENVELDIEDGQFDDAEEETYVADNSTKPYYNYSNSDTDDLRTGKWDALKTRLCENEDGDMLIRIPISRLMEFNGLQKICPSVDMLRSILKSSENFTLSSDEMAILSPLTVDDERGNSLSSDDSILEDLPVTDSVENVVGEEIDTTVEECWD